MKSQEDLKGKTFGKLTVISLLDKDNKSQSRWLCQCECGNRTIVYHYNLLNGHTKSCGCLKVGRKIVNLINAGERYGHLTVIKSVGIKIIYYGDGDLYCTRQYYLCQCDCGNTKELSKSDLDAGVISCGCIKRGRKSKKNKEGNK